MRPVRESVVVTRPVTVERIPDGTPLELEPGTPAQVTQALGSHFTLHVGGRLVRLDGSEADAIGRGPPQEPAAQGGAGRAVSPSMC